MLIRTGALALALCLASAHSQVAVRAPTEVLAAFGVTHGTVQDLALPRHSTHAFEVHLTLDSVERTLFLAPHDVRAANFQLLVHDGDGVHRLPTPVAVTFRGSASGLRDSHVAAALIEGQLHATIHTAGGDMWAIEPVTTHLPTLPWQAHIAYRARDVRGRDARCGVSTSPIDAPPRRVPGPAALHIAELAVDVDARYYALFNSDPVRVQNRVVSLINAVNLIYRRDCEIEYGITAIVVRTTNIYAWNGDVCNLLTQFEAYWNANHGAITRALAHLFTGEGTFTGLVGCANVGVVCTSSAYGVSKAYSGNLATDISLIAHETGHNWNAPHCDAQSACNIMCSTLGGCSANPSSFTPYCVNFMLAHRNSRTCLGSPVAATITALAPSTVTSWTPAAVELTGTSIGSVTSVTVGGQAVNFTMLTPTTLRFTPPSPFNLGAHPVVVSNSVGPSNPLNVTVVGNHPSVLDLSPVLLRNFPALLTMHGDQNWVSMPYLSTSNVPSAAPGIVRMGLGNNFSDLIQLSFLVGGSNGSASYPLVIPRGVPAGLTLFSQLVTFDPFNLMLPLEVSNVVRSDIR